MPVPTLVTDLSTTLASNSPAGSDNVFPDLDNYLRALSGFVASIRDNSGNGWVSPYLPLAGGTVTGATTFSSTVALNGALSGTGLTTYLASPPAIGGTTPNTGAFTTLAASSDLTLSGGTANGVLYLNGSKVATSGSALTFDGTNFTTTGYAAGNGIRSLGGNAVRFYNLTNSNWSQISAPVGTGDMQFDTGAGEQMRLTSTGLGIGTTSPQRSLHINGSVGAMRLQGSSVGGYIEIVGPTTTNYIGTPAAIASGSTTDLGFYLNGFERARITATGNQVDFQPSESAQNTSATLSVAQLQNRIITSNAAVTLTLPTGTTLEGYTTGMSADTAFECTFIATTANAITIAANGNTTVGNLTVSGNTSGTFRFRKTATNTFTVYRVA